MCHFVDHLGNNLEEIEIRNVSSSLTALQPDGVESFEQILSSANRIKSLIVASNNRKEYQSFYFPRMMHALIDHKQIFSNVCVRVFLYAFCFALFLLCFFGSVACLQGVVCFYVVFGVTFVLA